MAKLVHSKIDVGATALQQVLFAIQYNAAKPVKALPIEEFC